MIDAPSPPAARARQGKLPLVLASLSLAISLAAFGLAGFVAMTADIDLLEVQSEPTVASASQVEAIAHVTLPPGTVLLSAVYSNGLESRRLTAPHDQCCSTSTSPTP